MKRPTGDRFMRDSVARIVYAKVNPQVLPRASSQIRHLDIGLRFLCYVSAEYLPSHLR
jgi:hypothetical protein